MRGGSTVPVPRLTLGRGPSFGAVGAAYAVAVGAGVGVLAATDGWHLLVRALVADVVATLLIWCASLAVRNGSMYDPYWSVIPPLVIAWWASVAPAGSSGARPALVLGVVLVWSVRLTVNWVRGWPGLHHEDWRYPQLYERWPIPWPLTSLIAVHLVPTAIVFAGMLPAYAAVTGSSRGLGVLDGVATLVGLAAVTIELVADEQLRVFNRTKAPGAVIEQGLWAWSRHPNYFGELTFWWALWVFALAAGAGWWWTVVGPLGVTAMFAFASIPMMDERSAARRPAYAGVMARVPALVPWLPRRVSG